MCVCVRTHSPDLLGVCWQQEASSRRGEKKNQHQLWSVAGIQQNLSSENVNPLVHFGAVLAPKQGGGIQTRPPSLLPSPSPLTIKIFSLCLDCSWAELVIFLWCCSQTGRYSAAGLIFSGGSLGNSGFNLSDHTLLCFYKTCWVDFFFPSTWL